MNRNVYEPPIKHDGIDNRYLFEFVKHADQLKSYIKQMTKLTQHDFRMGRIDRYSYEHKINILTVMDLPLQEMKSLAERQLNKNLQPYFDARI